ncbi:hypothetical protein ACN47E_005973 [Coniothyrium glycines]
MLLNMSRPPSIPAHPGAPPLFDAFPAPHTLSSRPDLAIASQQHRSRDPGGSVNNAQQLPSLRTLLEPELLDKKPSDASLRSTGRALVSHGNGSPFEAASSPTLKRRHDFDGYSRGYPGHNAIPHQTLHTHRPPFSTASIDVLSASASAPLPIYGGSRFELQRRESYAVATQQAFPCESFRSASTTSDPASLLTFHSGQDDVDDASRPMRRRLDGSSRAPTRQSQVIERRDIPGEGSCFIYDDGTYVRAIIDGEPVNPSWGITKAGKPRKRLAQACLTCREKKIKCEPAFPKCHQCTKSQRVCRGGLNQAGMSNASGETSPSSSAPLLKIPSTEFSSPTTGTDKTKISGELRDRTKQVDLWNVGTLLRTRSFPTKPIATSRDMSVQSLDSDWSDSAEQGIHDSTRGSYHDQIALQWDQDPFETDPGLTLCLLDLYFLHAGRVTYGLFPRGPFIKWVQSRHDKDQDSLMLLYSVLALGSLFSSDPDKRTLGKRFAAVASYAAEKRFGKFSLQLCQTRLMLALYLFARGRSQEAWDFCGAGLRAISALRINTEEGVQELAESVAHLKYGFDHWTFEECCRRTFWSGLLMDRYNGFFGGTLSVISLEDASVRLPCSENLFETSTPCEAPFFDDDLLLQSPSRSLSLMGDMAYLCLISTLWGEVLAFTRRAARRPEQRYIRQYEAFYAKIYERLEGWRTMLPDHLQYNLQNLDSSIQGGSAGTFISLHALYHATIIRLNRNIRLRAMPHEKIHRNIDQAIRHASVFTSIMHALAAGHRQQRLSPTVATELLFSTPFPGYALMLSIDVLTSAGSFSTLPNLIKTVGTTLTCIDELADFWASARIQQRIVASRLKQLTEIVIQDGQGNRNGNHGSYWRLNDSLETAFDMDDALYKADDNLLFDVVSHITGE